MRMRTTITTWLLVLSLAGCKLGITNDPDDGEDDDADPIIAYDQAVVVYRAYQADTARTQLYATAADGSGRHLLAPELQAQTTVGDYRPSPGGTYVAYRLGAAGATTPQPLYIANVHTGATTEITGRPGTPSGALAFEWSPLGTHLAYTGGDATSGAPGQLLVYDVVAGESARVSPGETPAHSLSTLRATPDQLRWSPNGAALAYRSDYGIDELNAVAPDGSNYRLLSAIPAADGTLYDVIEWAPDSSRIAYVAAQDNPNEPELFVTRFDGTGNQQLSPVLPGGGAVLAVRWSPDARYAAMAVAQDALAGRISLVGSAADASHTWTLADDLVGGRAPDSLVFEWSYDANYVAYLADDGGLTRFYSSAVPTADVRALSAAGSGDAPDSALAWEEPDGALVAFTHDPNTAGAFELYIAAPTGGTTTRRISGTLPAGADVREFAWSPLGETLAYRIAETDRSLLRIFDATSNATTEVASFSEASPDAAPAWLPASRRLVFVADIRTPDVRELHASDRFGALTTLSHRLGPNEDVLDFAVPEPVRGTQPRF